MEGSEVFACHLNDYDYDLPSELIAQIPSPGRDRSRLLILDRKRNAIVHRRFEDVCEYLKPGDVLVVNDTRVVPARLCGTKESGGRVEVLVMDPYKDHETGSQEGYQCLIKAAKRTKAGSTIMFEGGLRAKVLTSVEEGKARVLFLGSEPVLEILERCGRIPLPPYIHRDSDQDRTTDKASYQTVYASNPGAVAAPTAGLHFSSALLNRIESQGVSVVPVTLHVGYGTFAPIRVEDVRNHRMHEEFARVCFESARKIGEARKEGRRIVAVGTTVVRILEWLAESFGSVKPFSGFCNHYIYPGYRFKVVDVMITNFHLPKSTLLLLVSAFAGRRTILDAYREAIREQYRFFSYGDAMMIL